MCERRLPTFGTIRLLDRDIISAFLLVVCLFLSIRKISFPRTKTIVSVKIFAKVPYQYYYYDTGCLDEESLGMDRVANYAT